MTNAFRELSSNIKNYPRDSKFGFNHSPLIQEGRRIRLTNPEVTPQEVLSHVLVMHGGLLLVDSLLGIFAGAVGSSFVLYKLSLENSPIAIPVTYLASAAGLYFGATTEFSRIGRHVRKNNPERYFSKK